MCDAGGPDAGKLLGTPLHVSWVVTSRCNLACDYCLEDARPATVSDDVPEATRELIAREIVAARVLKVSISGGEPLLVESLPRHVARLREGGVFVRMTTNGALLDEALADRLAEARLSVAEISLHPDRDREVLRAVSLLAARGVRTIARVVVSRANAPTLEDIVAPFRTTGVERIMLQEVAPLGRAAGGGRGSLIGLEEMREVRERVEAIRRAWGDDRVRLASSTLADHDAGRPVLCSLGGRVRKSCEVRPDGNVIPCAPATVFGVRNVLAGKGLAACWRDIPRLYARFAEEEPGGECGACVHASACHGGCRAVSRVSERSGRAADCAHFRPGDLAEGAVRAKPVPVASATQ
ncbi:MAG: radical SAM protein [Planctomycetota bacterium]|jgi:radical SAM protein with 4Fe4S-binding SPASM domain